MQNPWTDFKWFVIIFLPFTILAILGLILNWLILFAIFGVNSVFGAGIIIMSYFYTVKSISIDKERIVMKFPLKQIKTYYWNQLMEVVYGYKKDTMIMIRISQKKNYAFNVDRYFHDKIIDNYEAATGKKARMIERIK